MDRAFICDLHQSIMLLPGQFYFSGDDRSLIHVFFLTNRELYPDKFQLKFLSVCINPYGNCGTGSQDMQVPEFYWE
ncbi:hypothetical protein [Pedobacter caeni]|uniref:hypothetical protein n=1 Tax=Pedobacter caeni TaxID=288992 RepID=UPI0013566A20|nr:hypothetical protein [Pedobacter caeni]